MKAVTVSILFVVFFSCKQEAKKIGVKNIFEEETPIQDCIDVSEVLIEEPIEINEDSQDCIFDRATQTDDFLEGIKELENYIWDNETKTAEIVLNAHWSLTIYRGGCDEFEMAATFYYDSVLDIEKDKDIIFEKIIWIVNLLDDFYGKEALIKTITENKYSISKENDNYTFVNFMYYEVYESYFMDFVTNINSTRFSISCVIN